MEQIRDRYLAGAAELTPRRSADVQMYSTVTGELVDTGTLDAEYWYRVLPLNRRDMAGELRQTVFRERRGAH